MSRFSDFFRNLFGRRKREENQPPPPRPVDPAYQAYLDQKNAEAPQGPITPAPASPSPEPALLQPRPATAAAALPAALQTSGEPNDPGFLPEPARTDIYGRPVAEAPFGRNNYGAPFASMEKRRSYYRALAIRDGNQAKIDESQKYRYWNGPVAASTVTDDEAAFLWYVCSNYRWDPKIVQQQHDALFAILGGPHVEIARVAARGDALAKAGYNPDVYQGRMRGYVDQVANGLLKPRITYPGYPGGGLPE